MHSEQNVCAQVRVVVGSVKGARQMQQTYVLSAHGADGRELAYEVGIRCLDVAV